MSVVDYTIAGLEKAREQLVGMPKADLTHQAITKWYEYSANYNAIQAAEAGSMLLRRILHAVNGLNDAPPNVLDDARKNIVDHLDAAISKLDATRPVRSILEDRILRVKDTKLSRLLSEFNLHSSFAAVQRLFVRRFFGRACHHLCRVPSGRARAPPVPRLSQRS
jgi:hypothetical protein